MNIGRTMVAGDCHGCGLELEELIVKANIDGPNDRLILVGDLFDRGKYGHVVWEIIRQWGSRCTCLLGNHERKLLKWLRGERPGVPRHYEWAVSNLERHNVSRSDLEGFCGALVPILAYYPAVGPEKVIIVHAGINVEDPMDPAEKYTVYGGFGDRKELVPWWDRYTGETLVIYGHLGEADHKPRVRANSIGVDTGCVRGGKLTGYIVETGEVYQVEAHKDWYLELKDGT